MKRFLLSILLAVFALVAFDQAPVAVCDGPAFEIVALDALHMSASTASIDDSRNSIQLYSVYGVLEVVILLPSMESVVGMDHYRKDIVRRTLIDNIGEYGIQFRS